MFETSKLTLYYNVGGSGRVANGANDDFDLKSRAKATVFS